MGSDLDKLSHQFNMAALIYRIFLDNVKKSISLHPLNQCFELLGAGAIYLFKYFYYSFFKVVKKYFVVFCYGLDLVQKFWLQNKWNNQTE